MTSRPTEQATGAAFDFRAVAAVWSRAAAAARAGVRFAVMPMEALDLPHDDLGAVVSRMGLLERAAIGAWGDVG